MASPKSSISKTARSSASLGAVIGLGYRRIQASCSFRVAAEVVAPVSTSALYRPGSRRLVGAPTSTQNRT